MRDRATCEVHPGQKIIAQCSACRKGICRTCRETYGYFCSEECKQAVGAREEPVGKPEEEAKLAKIRERVELVTRVTKRYVLPGAAALLLFTIIYKVTGKAGEVIWEFSPPEDLALSALAVSDESLFLACADEKLYALDKRDGRVRWTYHAGKGVHESKPALVGDVCVAWAKSSMYGLDSKTGKLAWKKKLDGPVGGEPVAEKDTICFVCDFHRPLTPGEQSAQLSSLHWGTGRLYPPEGVRTGSGLYAVDCRSGKELWKRDLKEKFPLAGLAAEGGVVYLSKFESGDAGLQQVFMAVDLRTGKGIWKALVSGGLSTGIRPTKKGVLAVSSENLYFISPAGKELWRRKREKSWWTPVVLGEGVYCMKGEQLTCLDLLTGKEQWKAQIGEMSSEPILADGLLLVSTFTRKPIKEPAGTGFPTYRAPGLDDLMKQVADDRPQFRYVPALYAIDIRTGNTRWNLPEVGGKLSSRAGYVFAVESGSALNLLESAFVTKTTITAVNPRRGKVLWKFKYDGDAHSLVSDGKAVYFCVRAAATHTTAFASMRAERPKENVVLAVSIGR